MCIKLSIIVPIYNVEKYIDKCLKSIFGQIQSLPVEVVLVNDGSTDNSYNYILPYVKKYNPKVITKPNGGLSSARNAGLDLALGEYVWFVDSDDWLPSDAVSNVLKMVSSIDGDAYIFRVERKDESGKTLGFLNFPKTSIPFLIEGYKCLVRHDIDRVPMQQFVIKRAFLTQNSLRFKEGILHEDIEFAPRLLIKTNKLVVSPCCIYNYLIRVTGSITSTKSSQRAIDLYETLCSHELLLKEESCKHVRNALEFDQARVLRMLVGYVKYSNINFSLNKPLVRKIAFRSAFQIKSLTFFFKFIFVGLYPNSFKYYHW